MSEPPQPPPGLPEQPPQLPDERLGQDAGMRLLLPVGRSVWAIVSGYLGLFAVFLVPAPLALGTGIFAVIDIRKSQNGPNPKHGMGRAIFGIISGAIFTLILLFVLYNVYLA